jgi:hypothetical protein
MFDNSSADKSFTPPWSRIESLKEMTAQAGIDYDQFIRAVRDGADRTAMAEQFKVKADTIDSLREHFFRYGISSVIGGD